MDKQLSHENDSPNFLTKDRNWNHCSPLPPNMRSRFLTIVVVWPEQGGGDDPVIGNYIHSSDTVGP